MLKGLKRSSPTGLKITLKSVMTFSCMCFIVDSKLELMVLYSFYMMIRFIKIEFGYNES